MTNNKRKYSTASSSSNSTISTSSTIPNISSPSFHRRRTTFTPVTPTADTPSGTSNNSSHFSEHLHSSERKVMTILEMTDSVATPTVSTVPSAPSVSNSITAAEDLDEHMSGSSEFPDQPRKPEEVEIPENQEQPEVPTYDNRALRLPIHPTACVVCRRCLYCSHLHGEPACNCAGLGFSSPSRGVNLPSNMQDSRSIDFNHASPLVRDFTIKWVRENADKIYQPLYYLSAVETNRVNVCSQHHNDYLTARKLHFNNSQPGGENPQRPPKLIPGTHEHQQNEKSRKIIHYPTEIMDYLIHNSPSWNAKLLTKAENHRTFHVLRLDTCKLRDFEQNEYGIKKPSGQRNNEIPETADQATNTASGENTIVTDLAPPLKEPSRKRKNAIVENIRSTGQAAGSILSTTQVEAASASSAGNTRIKKRKTSHTKNKEKDLGPGNYISVSIWNAPSLENWTLTKCYGGDLLNESVRRLIPLDEFAADSLIVAGVVVSRDTSLLNFLERKINGKFGKSKKCNNNSFTLPTDVIFRCTRNWKLEVDMSGNFSQFYTFDNIIKNNSIDLYVGRYVDSPIEVELLGW